MSIQADMAHLNAVCAENARLLGQEQVVYPRRWRGGIRMQVKSAGKWVRGAYREYHSIEAALAASEVAARRATKVAALMADGVSLETAVAAVTE